MLTTYAPRFRAGLAIGALIMSACGGDDDPVDPTPNLEPPTAITVTATSATTAHLAWTAAATATSYLIQRAQGTAGGFENVGSVSGTSFDDSGLNPETEYRYQVASVAGSDVSGFSAVSTVTTPIAQVPTVEVTADITTSTTWTADKVYLLKGFIHVANGATLTIQAGTRIVGDFNTLGASLFVLRGARINAQGSQAQPIVFTSSRAEGQRQAGDWGGLIIVGNGIINRAGPLILEGTNTGAGNPPVDYAGGTDNADNSGTLRYVRVEFAGYATAADQELNTFTFAALGSGTTLEYLQSNNGLDDAFEFFGGAVNGRYFVSYNAGDDHFDMSEGYVGHLQWLIAYQTRTVVPRALAGNVSTDPQGIENDGCNGAGCTNGQNSLPRTVPMVANATLVGPPSTVTNSAGNIGLMLRRGTAGYYVNILASRWGRAGISLRDQTTVDRVTDGTLVLRNILITESPNVFQTGGSSVQGTVDQVANAIETQPNATATSLFLSVPEAEPANNTALDFSPSIGSPAASGGLETFNGSIAEAAGTVVVSTVYRGAAGTGSLKWWQGWTKFAIN